ncbi:MAG: hypothetical protein JSR27_00085 [Proteobacteria bacterium]|nr:hypothetical protein [Pseudomonadota bacterium]
MLVTLVCCRCLHKQHDFVGECVVGRKVAFEALLDCLYASTSDIHGGTPAFLEGLSVSFRSHVIAVQIHDLDHHAGTLDFMRGLPLEEAAKYASRAENHLWMESAGPRLLAEEVVDDQGLVPGKPRLPSRLCREALAPVNVHHAMGMMVWSRNAELATVGTNRNRRHKQATAQEHHLARLLLPHLRNVYNLQQRLSRLECAMTGFRAALDQLTFGVVLVNRRGDIEFANKELDRLAAEHRGLYMRQNRLQAAWPADRPILQQLLARACAGVLALQPESLVLHNAGGVATLMPSLSPLCGVTTHLWAEPAAAAALFVHPITPQPQRKRAYLQQLFGLTDVEAQLVVTLAQGDNLVQAGERLGKSVATLRTQLRSVFDKTGTRRQAALLRLIGSLPGS